MVTFLALWVPSDKNKQKSWPCMRSRPAGVNRFDQILDISKHLCGIVSDNNMIHCIHYPFSPIYFKVIVHRLKLSTFRRSKSSVIWAQETVLQWKLIVMKVIRPD